MSPSEARCGPWLAVRMRTSWPRSRRFSYRYRTCWVDAARQRDRCTGRRGRSSRSPSPALLVRRDPALGRPGRVPWRPRPPARIAVVAARCRRAGPGRATSSRASRARLRSCRPNTPTCAGRAVERAAVVGRAGLDRAPQVVGRAARERRPARRRWPPSAWASLLPTRGQAVLVGEAHDPIVPRPSERRRVERLERVRMDGGVAVVEQPAEHPALGAQRVRDERDGPGWRARPHRGSRRSSSAATCTSGRARSMKRASRCPPQRRHLLTDDDLDRQAAVLRDRPAPPPRHRSARDR